MQNYVQDFYIEQLHEQMEHEFVEPRPEEDTYEPEVTDEELE